MLIEQELLEILHEDESRELSSVVDSEAGAVFSIGNRLTSMIFQVGHTVGLLFGMIL